MSDLGKRIIYRSMKDMVGTGHTALIVWDVQNALVNSIFNKQEFLQNLRLFIDSARRNDIPIIYSKITPLPLQYESSWRIYMAMKRYNVDNPEKIPLSMQPGTPESEIHQDVRPLVGDMVVNKHTASIFTGTSFENMMRNRGVETLLFTGIATEIGVDSSARDSINLGFYSIVVADCVSSTDKHMHEAALETLGSVCIVASSSEIMKEWK